MATILDLPAELLTQVFEDLGGRELRRKVGNLTICRRWYEAAHAVYLSGLDTSNMVLYGANINDLAGKWSYATGQRYLMHKNTRTFYFRFLGHFWDKKSGRFLEENYNDPDALEYDLSEVMSQDEPPDGLDSARCWPELRRWRREDLIPRLNEIFQDLRAFTALEHLTLDAALNYQENVGPQWKYIYSSTIATLLRNLPLTHSLSSLTLDLCSGLDYDEQDDAHICDEVATVLPYIETVRLRLRLVCPDVLQLREDVKASEIKLKNLIIKVHQPDVPAGVVSYRSICCVEVGGSNDSIYLHESIIRAAKRLLAKLSALRGLRTPSLEQGNSSEATLRQSDYGDGMQLLRISFMENSYPNVITIDCLTMRRLCVNIEYFAYEDNGTPYWFEHKDEILVSTGQFEFSE